MSVSKNAAAKIDNVQADTDALQLDTAAILADTTIIKADGVTLKADTATLKADTTTLKADTTTLKSDTGDLLEYGEHIEGHFHHKSRTFGISADQSGDNWATEDRLVPFVAISGNGDYGSDPDDEAKIFGTDDTPFISGQTTFDPGEIIVTNVSNDNVFIIRMIWGTGTMAAAISAGQYSTKPAKFDSTNPQLTANTVVNLSTPRLAVGTKVWVQTLNGTDNATINFLVDAHGYV